MAGEEQQQQQTETAWYAGKADAELIGHMQNRGWHDKPIVDVAIDAIKSHRDAEKLIGAPATQIVRLPTDPKDEAGWKAVWGRLGAPADAKDYDFTTVKTHDGKDIDTALADALRATVAAVHLPKDAATRVASDLQKHLDQSAINAAADRTAKLQEERTKLQTNWGPNAAANMHVAKQAALALGVSEAAVAALEGQIGYAEVMDMFRKIGSKIGEDKFVRDPMNPANNVMTVEQAVARKGELMNDDAWKTRYMAGDNQANREMTALLTIISGAQ